MVDADDFVSFSVNYQYFSVESDYLRLVVEVLLYNVAQAPKEICGDFFDCIEGRD